MKDNEAHRSALENLGVVIDFHEKKDEPFESYFKSKELDFGLVYLIRLDVVQVLLPTIRRLMPLSKCIFHAPEVQFLREQRAEKLTDLAESKKKSFKTKEKEIKAMEACDHVVLVSEAEVSQVKEFIDSDKVSVLQALYSDVIHDSPGFDERENIFFIGGFKHLPNVSAVIWFCEKIWPRVREKNPHLEFHIIGESPPPSIQALHCNDGIKVLGHLPVLDSALNTYRLSVAPLTFGAGIKGKVSTALGAGIPVIATTIAAEGMSIIDEYHALVRDEEASFADAILELYENQEKWHYLSQNGKTLVEKKFGERANFLAFMNILEESRSLNVQLYLNYIRNEKVGKPEVSPEKNVCDISIIVNANAEKAKVDETIASFLISMQLSELSFEIILVQSLSRYKFSGDDYKNIQLIKISENSSEMEMFNQGAEFAKGEFLAFVSAGTVAMPNWSNALWKSMKRYSNVAMLGSNILDFRGELRSSGKVQIETFDLDGDHPEVNFDNMALKYDRSLNSVDEKAFVISRDFWMDSSDIRNEFPSFERTVQKLCSKSHSLGRKTILSAKSHLYINEGLYINDDPLSLIASEEKYATKHDLLRRQTGKLRILYFSSHPSHPDNHGNQRTIQSFGKKMKEDGHEVHFALLESNMYNHQSLEVMKKEWDSLTILSNSCDMISHENGVPFDGWYSNSLGQEIYFLCKKHEIDVVFCTYIFQSKLLDYVPSHILKIIDTHDKMGNRYDMLKENKQRLEFFSCSPEEEGRYLNRADIVVARRPEEADYFDKVSGRKSAIVVPHLEDSNFIDRNYTGLNTIGLVASANEINKAIVLEFLSEIQIALGGEQAPFDIQIAGEVISMIKGHEISHISQKTRSSVNFLGYVSNLENFYRSVDLIVSPVSMGTGINVKTVQAMAYGVPLLTTRIGSKGIKTSHPMHKHNSIKDLVNSLIAIKETPSELNELAKFSKDVYSDFLSEGEANLKSIFKQVKLQ